jgi:hypothetical protein
MFNLIPVSLLITAIGGIVYIISNHLSEFSSQDRENEESGDNIQFNFKARFVEWINQLPLDNVKSQSFSITQKLLHRFRLTLLKTDNYLMKLIGKISERDRQVNGNGNRDKNNNETNFWEKLANGSEDFTIKDKSLEKISVPTVEPEVKINFVSKPVKIYSEIPEVPIIKKTLKKKKYSPLAGRAGK